MVLLLLLLMMINDSCIFAECAAAVDDDDVGYGIGKIKNIEDNRQLYGYHNIGCHHSMCMWPARYSKWFQET